MVPTNCFINKSVGVQRYRKGKRKGREEIEGGAERLDLSLKSRSKRLGPG